MKKSDLTTRLAIETYLSRADAESVVTAVVSAITGAIASEETVTVAGYAIFSTRAPTARQGCNPRTAEAIMIAASTTPTFKAGRTLPDAVQ